MLKLTLPIDSKIDNDLWYKQKEQKNNLAMQDFIEISTADNDWGEFPSRSLSQSFSYGIYTITLLNQ